MTTEKVKIHDPSKPGATTEILAANFHPSLHQRVLPPEPEPVGSLTFSKDAAEQKAALDALASAGLGTVQAVVMAQARGKLRDALPAGAAGDKLHATITATVATSPGFLNALVDAQATLDAEAAAKAAREAAEQAAKAAKPSPEGSGTPQGDEKPQGSPSSAPEGDKPEGGRKGRV